MLKFLVTLEAVGSDGHDQGMPHNDMRDVKGMFKIFDILVVLQSLRGASGAGEP